MNPIKFVMRRPFTALMMVVAVIGGGVFALYKIRPEIPGVKTAGFYAHLDEFAEFLSAKKEYVVAKYESYFHKHGAEGEEAHVEPHKIVLTSPLQRPVTITQEYVCQIRSRRHIDVKALQDGYLEAIPVMEGQSVKQGDVLFRVVPTLYQARLDAKIAEADLAQQEYNNTENLFKQNGVAQTQVMLFKAKLARAVAERMLAQAELNFATVRAPFDGIVDRLLEMQGSLIKEGDILTTLSDNSVMWVYFNVPEKRYLEYMAEVGRNRESPDIKLILADHNPFPYTGKIDPSHNIGAIEAQFNNETGNIAFRADFPNPDRLLRHGQTGTVKIDRVLHDAIVIPQRATFENLAKRYVFVVGEDEKVHQREIVVQNEQDDIYVIKSPSGDKDKLGVKDKIVLEGIRQVSEGDKVEGEFRDPVLVMRDQKYHAE